ncbi:MAG: hypothetical protein AABN33_29905 [Acidobacteriota bacterium]
MVTDGQEDPPYDQVGGMSFSLDSKRKGYVAWKGNKRFIVVDGKELDQYDAAYLPVFSPDSKRLAYVAKRTEKFFLIDDGKEGKPYDEIQLFTLSGNAGGLLSRSRIRKKFIEGATGSAGTALIYWGGPIFSPDSSRLAFVAKSGDKWHLVVDGKEGPYDEIFAVSFSPDCKRVAYAALLDSYSGKCCIVLDDIEGPQFEELYRSERNYVMFDSSESLHYIARKGKALYLIEETIK